LTNFIKYINFLIQGTKEYGDWEPFKTTNSK
jgi:hypothetical protein